MFATLYNKVTRGGRRLAAFIALLALTTSSLVALEPPPPAAAAIVTNNLVLNLDGNSTTSLAATSPTTWNSISPASTTPSGTINGPSRYTETNRNGLTFTSSNGVYFPAGTARTAGDMSFDAWVRPGNLNAEWNLIASRWFTSPADGAGGAQDWHFGIRSGKLHLATASTGSAGFYGNTTFPQTSANKWYHVGFTINASTGKAQLFINGQADSLENNATHTDNATAQLWLGENRSSGGIYGAPMVLSKVRIYSAALTASQQAQNYLTDSANYGYAPANTVAPSTTGIAKVGTALSTSGGTWGVGDADGTTTTYQWQTSANSSTWTNISGATSANYTPVAGDATNYLRVVVTKTNSAGTATATSSATLRVQAASGTALISGGKLTGLTTTVPNDANTYNVTLATNNLFASMALGTTTGLTLVGGYASTAAYMATTIGGSAPIISFRGTGTAINTALANLTYTSSTQQVDVVKLYYASAGTGTETKNYIPIYDNNQLTFHYYAYKSHASGKNRADMDASVAPLSTTDGVEAPGPWYLSTPRYQVEWERIKLIVGQNQAFMGALADAGSTNWYWPANTDGYSSATIFGTQSGTLVTATSNIYNQTNTTLPFHSGEPNSGTSAGRSGFLYINNNQLGWDDIPLTNSVITTFTMETYGTTPFAVTSGSSGVLAQTVSVVASHSDAPTGFTASAAGTGSIVMGWNLATANTTGVSITGYRMEASTTSNFSTVVASSTSSTNKAGMISGLATNTLYYVRVMATTSSGNGAATSPLTVTTTSAATTITVVSSGGGTEGTDYSLINGYFVAKSGLSVNVNASAIQSALGSSSVNLAADSVVVNAPISWSLYPTLTIGNTATSTVSINKSITANSGSAWIIIPASTYSLDVASGASINFTGAGTSNRLYVGGALHTVLKTEADLATMVAGGKYALGKSLSLATSYITAPINLTFTGTLDGLGNSIDGMKIAATTTERIGLINTLATGGVVRNLGVTNVDVTLSSSNYRVGAVAGGSTGGTMDQVWSTGFIRTTTTNSSLSLGGLVGNVPSGTLNISKSWSSVNIDSSTSGSSTALEQGGIIGGDELTVPQVHTLSGGSVNLSQVYATGTLKWASSSHRGIGGIMGLKYSTGTTAMTDVFSWVTFASGVPVNNLGGVVGVAAGGTTTLNMTYHTTASLCVATVEPGWSATPNCSTKRTPGETVSGISGANWSTSGPSILKNLASPAKPLYVQVVAPTDGSYATVSYQIVDGSGAVQNTASMSAMNLSVSGTPVYKAAGVVLNAASAKASYSTYYDSGLTLSGSSASYYSLGTWRETTSVTISKFAQTVTWAPTTSVSFGSGTFTPSPAPVASGGTTITYSVSSAGTTGCTVNSTTGAITYTRGGSCAITATAASAGDWLIASDTETFVIAEPATAPTGLAATTAGSGVLNIGWAAPTVSSSAAITGYTLTYSTNSGMTSPTTVNVGNTRGYLLTGLTPGTVYYFQVRAVSGSTWTGPLSTTASATPNSTATTINVVASGGGVAGTDYKINGGVISTTGTANINASVIASLLATEGTVQLAATNVNVNSAIAWSANSTLVLGNTSSATVNVNSTISGSGNTAGVKILPATYGLSVKDGSYIRLTGATPSFNVGGTSYTVVNTLAGLANVASGTTWALTAPITLTATYTAAVKDFTFTGIMDGLGNTINSMTMNITATKDAGFYAALGGATVRNVGFTNVNISSPTDAINTRLGAVAGNGSITASVTNSVSQVWATGFINQTFAGTAKTEAGGLFGGAQTGTLNITKSWSSVAISTKAYSVGSGGIIGTNVGSFSGGTYSGAALTITESYSTGNILRDLPASPLWYGNAGIIGVSYGTSTTLTNVFSWGNINSTGGGSGTSTAGISGVGAATVSNAYTTHAACGGTATNCIASQTAGVAVTGGTGFTTGLWQSVNGTSLVNLTPPTKSLYVQVIAPTNGAYSTIGYQIVDSTGTVQTLSTLNLSVSGTPTYTITSASAIGAYSVAYVSGLTLGGTSASVYSLNAWITNTSVTISKYAQSISLGTTAPTTAAVGSTYTPTATATSALSVVFTIDSASSSVCTIASGVVTFIAIGDCVINANQVGNTSYLAATQVQQTATATAKGAQTVSFSSTAPSAKVSGSTYTPTGNSTSGLNPAITVDSGSSAICSIASGVVSFASVGNCVLNINQAGNANWNPASQSQQTVVVAKGDQTITFSSTAPTSAVVAGTTYTPAATSTSGGAVAFTVDLASSAVCSIASGVVSFQTAGACRVNANQAGNVNWNAATQNFQSFTVGKGTTTLAFTSTASNPKVNTTYTPVAASSGTGTVTYTIDGTSSSICSISAGVVTFNAVGTCKVNANQATDANYLAATATPQTITVVKGDQTITFSSIAPLAAVVSGTGYTPTATSTSGGSVSFTIDGASAAVCSITTGSVTFQSAGICKVLANQAGNANWNAAPQNFQTFTVGKGTPTLEFTSNATSPKVNSTYTPVASSSSSGNVTYVIDDTSASVCSIAAGVVSFTAVGSCKVNASQISDTNWLSVTQVQQTITVVQGDQTIAFSTNAPTSAVVAGATYTPTATSTSGGAVAFTIDDASSAICSITAGVVSFQAVGTCKVLGNQAGDTNWAAATENFQSFEVAKGAQVVAFTTSAPTDAVVDGTTYTVAATGGATNEAVVFTIDGTSSEVCSISGTEVSFTAAGTCRVNANQPGDANYEAAPQVSQAFTVGKGSQVVAFTSGVPNGVRVGDSGYVPTATGGSGSSVVAISVADESSSKCSISDGEVSFLAAGDCVLEVTQASDANYEAAQTVTQTIAIAKGLQTITQTNSVPAAAFVGMGTFTPTFTGGPSGNAVTLEISSGSTDVCSVDNGVITITGAGLCRYLVNQVGDDNYEAATEFVAGFMVDKGTQVISISTSAPSDAVVGGANFTPAATGGPTGYPVVFRVEDSSVSVCSISAGVVRFVGVGTCLIGATQSGDSNYEPASDSISFEVTKGSQAISFTSTAPTTAVVGGPQYSPVATGGATANNVVFQIASASGSICALTAGKISFQSPGDCVVEANQDGNTNYNAAPMQTQTISVGKGSQVLTFVSSAPSAARVGGTTYQPIVTGGPSTSAVAFSIAAAAASVCSVSNGVVSFTGVGDCVIEANQAGDNNYNSANQLTQTVSVAKGTQVVTFTSTPPSLRPVQGTTYTPTASSGGSGIAVVFTIAAEAASLCSISNGVITFQAVGDCVVYAYQAGNSNWNAAPQVSQVFDITKGEQVVTITSEAPTDAVVGGTAYQPTATGGSGTKAVTYSVSALSADICSANSGSVNFLAAGVCLVVANQAGDANYNAATPVVQSINVGKGSQSVAFSSIFLTAQVEGTAYRPTANTGASVSPAIFSIASLSSAICEIVSGTVYFHAVGDCVIELNQDGDANYNPAAAVTQVISVAKGTQLPLIAQTSFESLSLGETPPTTVIGVTGGSGTGAVTWTISPASASICSLSGDVVTGLSVGYCDLVATKAGDDNFLEETVELAILVASGGQTPVRTSVSVAEPVYEPGLELALALDGGNGTGAIWFESITPEVCTVTEAGEVSVLKGGVCSVIGHKAGDENFIAAQDGLTFTIARADQGTVNLELDRTLTYSPDSAVSGTLSVSGAKSSTSPSFNLVSGTCEISGTELSATEAGDCVVSVSVGQDDSYLAKTVERTFTVAKATPAALTATVVSGEPNAIAWRGKSVTHFNVAGGSGSGTISASTTTANICSVSLTDSVIEVTGLAQGTCVVSMNQATDSNYELRQTTFNVSVLDLPSAPQNFNVSNTGANQDGSMSIAVTWSAPATAATRAAVSGYEVQSKTTAANDWETVPNGELDAAATSLNVTVPPWSQVFFRVAPISSLDDENGANRNWITLTQSGTNIQVPFDVTGTLATISTNLAATTSGETVTLTGTGFDATITTRVQLSTASPVFAAGFGRAALAQTVVVPATVLSPTEIRFTLPKITLPKGRTSLATEVRILTANGISSQPVSLEYIPKKLAQTLALSGLPASKATLNIGGALVSGIATVAVVGKPTQAGATPTVTATPASVCTAAVVNRTVTVTPIGRGVCAISVVAPATPGFTASAAKTYSYTVKGYTQSITFANPGAKTYSASPLALTALSSALLPVTFSTTTTKTCSVIGSELKMIAAGPCTVTASQTGSSTVEAASKVTQTFVIAKSPRSAGLTATADSISATGERTSQTFDVTSSLAAAPVTVFVGENPVDIPVTLNKREGTLLFTVDAAADKAGICSAEPGEAGALLGSITMLDIGTCKVTIAPAEDAAWNVVLKETIVITVVGSAFPAGSVEPNPPIGDATPAPEDFDNTPGDVDTEPAVALNLDPTVSKSYSFGTEDGFAFDPASGKIIVKTRSVLVGTWTAILKSPSADKKWFKIKGKIVKKKQTYVDVASCTTKLTVKKDPKLKKKVSRVIGAGCLLSESGKAAFTAVGIQKIKMKYKRIRQYANTGLDYRGTSKAKTRILKKVNRTVVIKVGRTN